MGKRFFPPPQNGVKAEGIVRQNWSVRLALCAHILDISERTDGNESHSQAGEE